MYIILTTLTDGDFIVLSQHYVVWSKVPVDDMFFLVNVTQSQHDLQQKVKRERFTTSLCLFSEALQLEVGGNSTHITCKQPLKCLYRMKILGRKSKQGLYCTCIKMCQILSSENPVPFSFKELKCSPNGAPSTNSIITYSLSSERKRKTRIWEE